MTSKFFCLAPIVTMLLLASCTSASILSNVIDNREYIGDTLNRPLSVADARGTFLLKSSRLFYPHGIPDDSDTIPPLTGKELGEIDRMLSERLSRIMSIQEKHRALLIDHYPGFDIARAKVKLAILSQGTAVAATESSGRMFIDAKVVQAIYRSALLSVLVERTTPSIGKEQEREAFAEFADFNKKLGEMSSFLPLSDLSGFTKGVEQAKDSGNLGKLFGGMWGVLESRLRDMHIVSQSQSLEDSFLGAMEFLLAHEMAHLVLGHYPASELCAEAQERELIADRYAVLLNVLSSYENAAKVELTENADGSLSSRGRGATGLLFVAPDSFAQFFKHAYELAGFDGLMQSIADCRYPPSSDRSKAAQPFSKVIVEIITDARWADGLQGTGNKKLFEALGNSPFDHYYEAMLKEAEKRTDEPTQDYIKRHQSLLRDVFHVYYRSR
jgi:hypothetical protein